jgi:hypothetical protein
MNENARDRDRLRDDQTALRENSGEARELGITTDNENELTKQASRSDLGAGE